MNTTKRLLSPLKEQNESASKKLKGNLINVDKKENSMEQKAVAEENYDFLFNEEDEFDMSEFEAVEKKLIAPKIDKLDEFGVKAFEVADKDILATKLDLSQWQRCKVTSVERDKKTFALILRVRGKAKISDSKQDETCNMQRQEQFEATCHLQGPWCHTKVSLDDVVSLHGAWDANLNAYKVDKDQGFCVINPDILISGTSVVGSLFCRRKAVLQDRFRGIDGDNKVMVIGSIVHELLQTTLEKGLKQRKEIEKLASELINSQEIAFMLYSSNLTRQDTQLEILQFVQNIYNFVQQYTDESNSNSLPIQKESFQEHIAEIQDIEENLWTPQLGIKGKIDVSVKVQPRKQRGQMTNYINSHSRVLPLELKTGRASFSMEHKGQLILYQMMLSALGKPTQSGLLLYLRENLMREILGTRNEQRDLITLRNDLSYYLSSVADFKSQPLDLKLADGDKFIQPFELPEPISHPTACSKCAYATLCCTFVKTDPALQLRPTHTIMKLSEETISHLTPKDYEYFIKWCHFLMMEDQEGKKSNNLKALWCQSSVERQQMGRAICSLKIIEEFVIEKVDGRYKHQFSLENTNEKMKENSAEEDIDLTLSGFSLSEYVIVSTTKRIAVASGFVLELTAKTITINLERNLKQNYAQQTFIVDKHESQTMNVFNFTNLGILLDPTDRSEQLRRIIIQNQPPTFIKVLPKILATAGADIVRQLNTVQRAAAFKVMATESYMLIKGLPGTGKTQTLVAIIRLLHLMGKTILVTSQTHSAVDNLLIRLKSYGLPFLRLGSGSRVNSQLRDSAESVLTANCNTEAELKKLYDSYQIVGSTCLGCSHAIFSHRRFDYCIVDEATQVMQATVLRPLFFCERFILVGDPEQLPPIIRSPEARQRGADESLFHRLDKPEATSVLSLQYRMNKCITKLANDLTYQGSLQAATDQVKMATMSRAIPLQIAKEKWLQRALQTHVDQSVFLLDTLDCSERSYQYAKSKHSATCSLIEKTFNEEKQEQTMQAEPSNNTAAKSKRLGKYTNYCEAAVVFRIVNSLLEAQYDAARIGVIAPYRAQVELLKKLAQQHHDYYNQNENDENTASPYNFSQVEVNTVDQYQGRDKDIIIYSCSRTGPSNSKDIERKRDAEILEDKRRLTVAITRSKHKLIIVGDAACIEQYSPFKILLQKIPGFCKLKLEDEKQGFQWQTILEQLTTVIQHQQE